MVGQSGVRGRRGGQQDVGGQQEEGGRVVSGREVHVVVGLVWAGTLELKPGRRDDGELQRMWR